MDSQDSLVEQTVLSLGRIKQIGKEKDDLVQHLQGESKRKENLVTQLSDDLESEKTARRGLQQELKKPKDLPSPSKIPPHAHEFPCYVVVLLDLGPESFLIQPKYMEDKEKGGAAAAKELLDKAKEYLASIEIDTKKIQIRVHAYVSIRESQEPYSVQMGAAIGTNLNHFFYSFNKAYALAEITNLGRGITWVDQKVCANLQFYVGDSRCEHIILGVKHKSRYRESLQHSGIDLASFDRLTLLRGLSEGLTINGTGPKRSLILDTLLSRRFDDPTSPLIKKASPDLQHAPRGPSAASPNRKDHTRRTPRKLMQNPTFRERAIRDQDPITGKIHDRELKIAPNDPFVIYLQGANLCPNFYLRGMCDGCSDPNRNHNHQPLNDHQFDCLLLMARQRACRNTRNGEECNSRRCIYGHDQQRGTAGHERGSKRTMDDPVENSDPRRVRHYDPQSGR